MKKIFNSIRDLQDNVASCVAEFVCANPKFENCSFKFNVVVENGWVSISEVNFVDNEV